MKIWTIFRYEFTYLVRCVSTWLYGLVLIAFAMGMSGLISPGDGVYPNNTFLITSIAVLGGLLWLVMGATVAGEAAARDVQTRMSPLTYTTPISKLHYLGGRFMAAMAGNALLVLLLPLGLLLSFYLPGMEEEPLQPFRPWHYGSIYFMIVLPGAFVATALQFSFAALSRQVMTSYGASLLLALVAQILAVAVAKLFGNWDLVKLLDPVGVAGIVGNELQTWTPSEKNTRLVTLEGMFLWNRVLWIGVAVGALWFTYLRFGFTHRVSSGRWRHFEWRSMAPSRTTAEPAIGRAAAIRVPSVSRSFGFATWVWQTLRIAGVSFVRIARHPMGLPLVGAMALALVVFADRIMVELGIPLLPTTQQLVGYLTAPINKINTPWVVIPLLIMYFVGELIWREREAGLSDIADAAPVSDWVLIIGKFLGLGLIILVWMALLMAGGIGMQLSLGYDNHQIELFVQVLFGLQLLDYLLFALLAVVVHAVVNQKYIGYLLVLLLFSFMAFPSSFGVEHNLLIFGADPGWWYTDMRGFGSTLRPWLWFKAYWIAWALLLTVVARVLWVRGREHGLQHRLRVVRHRFTRSSTMVALLGAGLMLVLGSFIFYNTNVLNEYLTSSGLLEQKVDYERRYGRYRNTLQPQLTATRLRIELYPDRKAAEIQGTYTLVNKEPVPIDTLHIGNLSGAASVEVKFNRPASPKLVDHALGHRIYRLEHPLRPGDSLRIHFTVHYRSLGFRQNGTEELVVKNGTYFTNYDLLPAIGYQRQRELNDAVLRKKYKLAARPALPFLYDQEARKKPFSTDQAFFEAIVGTAPDEVAVAPGTLQRTWTEGPSTCSGQAPSSGSGQERRYFHFKTSTSIGGEYSILSGRYAMQEKDSNGVAIRIYYHPGHTLNVGRMFRSAQASLAYYTEQFGPYPYGNLTIVERAGGGGGATADAGIIYYGETYALMNPDDGSEGFDLPYYILAHEVAHQWWGLARLTPAHVEGAGVLIEGLAVYSGMQVLAKAYGDGHLRQYIDALHASYEMPRSLATASLLRANEPFLYYRKGGLALHALSEYLGKKKVNGAMRELLRKRSSGAITAPTTLHLYGELQRVTPDSLHYLLHDLFVGNTYWRLKTKKLTAEQTKTGHWEVTLRVEAQKLTVDSSGQEEEVSMQDWLEVGLYEEGKGLNKPLYLRKHRIRSGEQTIRVTVPRKPDRGGIDPNHLMIDLRYDDNMRQTGK